MTAVSELHALAIGFALLMVLSAGLMEVLARTVPAAPGPRWWSRACLLALAGLGMSAAAAWLEGIELLAPALWLLALGCVAEGLLRFGGRQGALRWVAGLALAYLLAALLLRMRGETAGQALFASGLVALLWIVVGLAALLRPPRGQRVIHAGIAACAAAAALGWVLHALLPARTGPTWRLFTDGVAVMLWLQFVACGLLVPLLVLAESFRVTERLRREAIHDPLTGALNRRGFEKHTARLAALSAQLGQSLAVLMLDIDHFKQVNDQHGHQVGDLALQSLARMVQRAKRESDAFARLGGEEFCVVLPGTDVPGARVFADRLRRSFAAFEIDTGSSFLSCTVSVGVAYASADTLQAGGADLVDLLHQADEALYEAKRAGRNRVRFYASAEVMSSRLDSRLFTSTMPHPEP
ncbi:GGDEF domain-containing protein [Caldimonas tepidiphila]|uniref:GGDEF domain-containing protein n=1 Tax=Caldimonas tepidiphila TaxID=2315841 RepID=UPI000E5A5278|nr:GGDEF domain-containing protein [Caldimonas tepidiphila]